MRDTKGSDFARKLPQPAGLAVKLGFSVFMAIHLWFNLRFYGPSNYLWFCDLGLLISWIGLWTDNRLLLSMTVLSSLGPAIVWCADILCRILTHHWLVGMAAYMTAKTVPLPVRLAASFHVWFPIMLIWCLSKLGYDRRAIVYQTLLAIVLLIVCRCVSVPPPAHGPADNVNINFVYGHSDDGPQTELPAWLYLTRMIAMYWVLMYLPIHLVLSRWLGGIARTRISATNEAGYPAHPSQYPTSDEQL